MYHINCGQTTERIKGTIAKALRLVAENKIQKGISTEKRFVKSTSGEMQHTVTVSQNRSIKCDKSCKHFKEEQYYAHVLSVPKDLLQPFIKVFKRCSIVVGRKVK